MNGDCSGKTKYLSKAQAINRINLQMKDRKRRKSLMKHRKLLPYKCRRCGGWHVGGTVPAAYTGIRRALLTAEEDRRTKRIELMLGHGGVLL